MKKFETSEDLDQLFIKLPLNAARAILTLCLGTTEKAAVALEQAKAGEVNLGPLQQLSLENYIRNYKLLQNLIADELMDNVPVEGQEAIKRCEDARSALIKAELVQTLTDRMMDSCDDPNCDSCKELQNLVGDTVDAPSNEEANRVLDRLRGKKQTRQSVADEFDITDLPEGTFIVPGSNEEN